MKENSKDQYVAGQCNIGASEVQKRLRMGYIGLALVVVCIIAAEFFNVPKTYKLLLFAPSALMFSGFLQAYYRFCFLFGFFGVFRVTAKHTKITLKDQLRKDRFKALSLIIQVILASMTLALIYYVL